MKYTVRERISRNINNKNSKLIKELMAEMVCVHTWTSYGFGYKCDNCKLYTGTNLSLNNLIKEI
jgi:hypothetical protein